MATVAGIRAGRYWNMVRDLDDEVRNINMTDWELTFIADMFDMMVDKQTYSLRQQEHIQRLWEKYCL